MRARINVDTCARTTVAGPDAIPQDKGRPWARGVPEDEQLLAREIFLAGNQEFSELRYAQALVKYREAVRHWNHPAIRFNMAVCLINLDQLVEAKAALDHSMAYGAAPLGADSVYLLGAGLCPRVSASV